MKLATITFANGQVIKTSINGTNEEIKKYYLGRLFNLGDADKDIMVNAVKVEIN